MNLGLRWEFATPLYERDNNWSNFNPATNTMIRATGGSLYNRALVHPDYKDFGPRLGFAYSFMPKTVMRGGYGISYDFFNRVGSAIEGINAPQALFGVFNQTMPGGRPRAVDASSPRMNSFTTGIANPANFNPLVSNVDYIPPNTPWPYDPELVPFGAAGDHQEHGGRDRLQRKSQPAAADHRRLQSGRRRIAPGGTSRRYQQRAPDPDFGPITWVDPAGNNHYNGLSARVEHRFGDGLYFLNSFTWGKAIGDSEQALEYYAGYVEANPQNIHNLAAEAARPAST